MTCLSDVRAVAVDLDHTLLTSSFELPDGAAQAIREVAARGTWVILATGRMPAAAAQVVAAMDGAAHYLVAHNGAMTIDLRDGSLVSSTSIVALPLRRLAEYVDAHDRRAVFLNGDEIRSTGDPAADQVLTYYQRRTGAEIRRLNGGRAAGGQQWHRVLIYAQQLAVDYRPMVESPLEREVFEEVAQLGIGGLSIQMTRLGYVECTDAEATKLVAIQAILGRQGLSIPQLMSIGDGYNDLEMISAAGVGVAVANAIPAVREAATMVVASNDAGGVREALERLLPASLGDGV